MNINHNRQNRGQHIDCRASTLDRLRHAAYRLVLDGKSYRTPRGDYEPENTTVEKGPKTAK